MNKYFMSAVLDDCLSSEGNVARNNHVDKKAYIILTDTKTRFSKLSRIITKDPYNHVSIALDEDLSSIYTFALATAANGLKGGFKIENLDILKGSAYSIYSIGVTEESHLALQEYMDDLTRNIDNTRYNHVGLFAFLRKRKPSKSVSEEMMICSEFVVHAFRRAGIELFKRDRGYLIKPYEIVKSHLLRFERRGVF